MRKKAPVHVTLALGLAALALTVVWLSGGEDASAVTFTVTKTADTADGTCDADCSLREAVMAANANLATIDIITIPPGTFTLSIGGAENPVNAAAQLDLDILNNLTTINGAGAGSTIIDGGYIDRIFEVHIGKNVTINNLTIRHGTPAGQGGGLTAAGSSTVTLNSVVVAENQANDGGGIWNGGSMSINASTIRDNVAGSNGGGILNGNTTAALTINMSAFHGNQAGGFGGGAIYNDNNSTISNSTISNNTATNSGGGGGGVLNYTSSDMTLWNVTLTDNASSSPDKGGGIRNFGVMAARNTIISGNSGGGGNCNPVGPAHYNQTGVGSAGDNITSDASCGFGAAGDMQNTNANLGGLQNNGGPTATRALLPGSPAINNDTHNGDCLGTDQRGLVRPSGAACDIGAYEYDLGPVVTPTPTPAPTSTPVPTPSPVPTPTLPPGAFGNVDCMDGISSVDSLKVLRANSGLGYIQTEPCENIGTEMTAWNELQGDVDCSGGANSVDALKLLRHSAGLPVAQVDPCPNIGS